MSSLQQLARDLASGKTTSRNLVEACLANISNTSGEGERAFIAVHDLAARDVADGIDKARQHGIQASPYAGIPVSIKDLFDIRGQVTCAGSKVLEDNEPAAADAPAVARLRAAGFVVIGRTNMTEFAYSGLGVNTNFPTPKNPYDRETGRIPGGSTSGGAVSVADGMAYGALGTDTGGSCRIPAALCGIVGYKPTQARVPLEGAVPLSFSLDSIGPLANTVSCCAIMDTALAGIAPHDVEPVSISGLRFAVPRSLVMDGMDSHVAETFRDGLDRISEAGAVITEISMPELSRLPEINKKGGFASAEAYAWHKDLLQRHGNRYDPWVKARIEVGADQSAAEYIDLIEMRQSMILQAAASTRPFDAVILPTVPIIAPSFAELEEPPGAGAINQLLLRNPAVANFLNRCAISIPCHTTGQAPVGLMLMGESGEDRQLFSVAAAIEDVIQIR